MPNLACTWANKLSWLGVSSERLRGSPSLRVTDRCPKWEPCQSTSKTRRVEWKVGFSQGRSFLLSLFWCGLFCSVLATQVCRMQWRLTSSQTSKSWSQDWCRDNRKSKSERHFKVCSFKQPLFFPSHVTLSGKQALLLYSLRLGCYTDNSATERCWWWERLFYFWKCN